MILLDDREEYFFSTTINNQNVFSGFGTVRIEDDNTGESLRNTLEVKNYRDIEIYRPIQEHTTDIHVLTKSNDLVQKVADGVVSTLSNVVLVVKTADCVPIIFSDKKHKIIGISHQGWKGSYNGMAPKMIEKMIELGGSAENITCSIGPSIGSCCYEIFGERLEMFLTRYPDFKDKIISEKVGKMYLDLKLLNVLLLISCGLSDKQIEVSDECTYDNTQLFSSYKRDYAKAEGSFKQMISFIIQS